MFRFTIRELLILTVTAGLAVGWWVDHQAQVSQMDFLGGKMRSLVIALEMREAMMGWGKVNSAGAILKSPTNAIPMLTNDSPQIIRSGPYP